LLGVPINTVIVVAMHLMLELAHHILLVGCSCSWPNHQSRVSKVVLMDLVIAMEGCDCPNSNRMLDIRVHHLRLLLPLFLIYNPLLVS